LLSNLTLFDLVDRRLDYSEQRHQVLARNIANADTPGFIPHDTVEPDFQRLIAGREVARPTLAATHGGHLVPAAPFGRPHRLDAAPTELKPSGNAVSLDIEAGKLRSNSGSHKLATRLYGKYVGMLRAALGQS